MGGEKHRPSGFTFLKWGSPPRGRGKVNIQRVPVHESGITPAWAGKRVIITGDDQLEEDHPRVGGEKLRDYNTEFGKKGSPPRGRGKVNIQRVPVHESGITPAWAGKRVIITGDDQLEEDHPRVGGEKLRDYNTEFGKKGSPPRGRGKAKASHLVAAGVGITPAWAGKRVNLLTGGKVSQDHPRVGGEKRFLIQCFSFHGGSPPRGRGKDGAVKVREDGGGITPAWAGKRAPAQKPYFNRKDHPRVGGEKHLFFWVISCF